MVSCDSASEYGALTQAFGLSRAYPDHAHLSLQVRKRWYILVRRFSPKERNIDHFRRRMIKIVIFLSDISSSPESNYWPTELEIAGFVQGDSGESDTF